MKKILLFLIVSFYFTSAFATRIDTATAYRVAENFLIEHQNSTKSISLKLISDNSKANDLLYIFDVNNSKGFVIVSANSDFIPVLAFSDESAFKMNGTRPDAYYEWLDNVENQMKFVLDKKIKASKGIKDKWSHYSDKKFSPKKGIKAVSPLLTTTWNQGSYYNELCPVDASGPGGHVWAGCVAVSMAQVIKYWNYPEYGSGEHSYNHYTYGEQYADFAGTNYDWISMPNSVSSSNIAVATLMYHCGVAVNMNYSPTGSGAYMSSAANALKNYFDFSKDLKLVSKYSYSNEQWDSLIMAQIDAGQPLSYSGGSHAFNVDGYQDSSYFHLNWGWGGSYNGYFYLSDLTPGGYDFTSGQQAIINIRPNCGEASSETDTIFDYSGTFYDNGGSYSNYMNCSDSKILIAPENATNILLSFEYFESVENQDTLFIYDGNDENAPLLASFSGDTIPDDILSNNGNVFLKFVSDSYTTKKGFQIDFTSSFDDVGVTNLIISEEKACGKSDDSLFVVIQNFGINTQDNIPIEIKVNTPHGIEFYNATYTSSLARNEVDSFLVGYINTLDFGEYEFLCYTKLAGDNFINENDTTEKILVIKEPKSLPYLEIVDSLDYDMGDWKDFNYATWISMDYGDVGGTKGQVHEDGNKFFSTHVFNDYNQFLIYNRKLENITEKSGVFFDYRILNAQSWPVVPDTLLGNEKINIVVSTDCGDNYQTIFTIDKNNHHPDSLFQNKYISLYDFAGQDIIFGFKTDWDTTYTQIDYDNILFVDSLQNNLIDQTVGCFGEDLTIIGTKPIGGIGELNYIWQQSADNIDWTIASGTNNEQNYFDEGFNSPSYFRRIVTDSMFFVDTSKVIFVEINECTVLDENNDKIKIYPNPASEKIFIQGFDNFKFMKIEIDNIQGQKIYYSGDLNNLNEINISNFEKGIYILKIISEDKILTRSFIKE